MRVRLTSLAVLIPLLAACDSTAPMADDEANRAATGEVLEGSISDAMLPLQDLRSQPPVAAPLPGEVVAAPAGSETAAPGDTVSAEADGATPAAEAAAAEDTAE